MRHVMILCLGCCIVASAAAQTEVIIRQPGQRDQVIQLSDSVRPFQMTLDNVMGQAVKSKMMAEKEQAMASQMAELQGQLQGQLQHWKVDTMLPSRLLTTRLAEAARNNAQRARLLDRQLESMRRQPHLGISVDYRSRDSDKWGAYVMAVTPGSPAERAGILSGDIITRIAGKSLTDKVAASDDNDRSSPSVRLTTIIAQLEVGKPVSVELRRGTQVRTVHVTPDDDDNMAPMVAAPGADHMLTLFTPRPSEDRARMAAIARTTPYGVMTAEPFSSFSYSFGFGADGLFANLELAPVNEKLGAYFGTSDGVLVVNTVRPSVRGDEIHYMPGVNDTVTVINRREGAAARNGTDTAVYVDGVPVKGAAGHPSDLGLEPGDVIVSVDGRKVTTPSQLMRIVGTYDRGEEFKLQIMRQKHAESISVTMP